VSIAWYRGGRGDRIGFGLRVGEWIFSGREIPFWGYGLEGDDLALLSTAWISDRFSLAPKTSPPESGLKGHSLVETADIYAWCQPRLRPANN